ncbi:MAG: ABC-2 family transporter protein [Verrucomicrobia bacterium]|nr:ABC-2 family transporter protein [Verrucomicrobiota bacterium]MBI3868881.1 ABC-2 family transporter protein [Verrucomicrobiota bacterium]
MRKYWHVLQIGIQNTLSYRVNFLFRSLFGLIPLTAVLSVWKTIYSQGGGAIAGYTLSQMISYYLVVTLVDMLTAVAEDDWQIAADIKDGRISQFLLKPIDYLGYRLTLFAAGRVMYAAMAVAPVCVFILLQREHFVFPSDAATWLAFGLSVAMTALLQFFVSYTLALLAFWLQEVSSFIFIVYAFEYLAGGHLFPLDILPSWSSRLLMMTPFPYQLYFPVNVFLGRATGAELATGLGIQAMWVLLAWGMARAMWRRGIRHYEAVGG